MMTTEGEERDRAECVYIQLIHGLEECSDEDEKKQRALRLQGSLSIYKHIFFTIITGDADLLRIVFRVLHRVIIALHFLIT